MISLRPASACTGCFFTGPALKVLSMELVPPNKGKLCKNYQVGKEYSVSCLTLKVFSIFFVNELVTKLIHFRCFGGTGHFSLLGGTSSILRSFRVRKVKKNNPVHGLLRKLQGVFLTGPLLNLLSVDQ